MIACVFDPGPCITGLATGAADAVLSLFPFGLYGIVFLAGMIVGERVGLWGIIIGVIGWIAIRFGTKAKPDDFRGEVEGNDAKSPDDFVLFPRKTRPKVRTAKRSPGKRRFNPDTNQWEEIK